MLTNEQIERLREHGHWFYEWNMKGKAKNIEISRTKEILLVDIIVRKFYWSNEIMELLKIVYGIDFNEREDEQEKMTKEKMIQDE